MVAIPCPRQNIEQRRALQLLAEAPHGMSDSILRRHGFSPTLIVGLVGAGFAEAKPRTMKAAGKRFASCGSSSPALADAQSDEGMMARSHEPIEPMTLENMRHNGARSLARTAGRSCTRIKSPPDLS
jgi:hypothetical protein